MVAEYENDIYLGTVLLEKNRWLDGERVPSFAVSDWVDRIAEAGFDGIELWQNHAFLVPREEQEKLRASPIPVKIFNSYDRCGRETQEERARAAEMAEFLSADGMKFNFGRDPARHAEYCETVKTWRAMLPRDFRFLCECHGGTTIEDPRRAAETFEQLGRSDYEIIIHGFGGGQADVMGRFKLHGRRITHIHACLSGARDGAMRETAVRARTRLLRDLGFRGSFTIEFTEGVGSDDEDAEMLFRNAVRDMQALRQCLSRTGMSS
jgi:sugar phosphate isomerase/epimerase